MERSSASIRTNCSLQQWQALAPDLWILHGYEDNSNPGNQGRIGNIVFARENTGGTPRGWLVGMGASEKMGQLLRCSLDRQLRMTVTDIVSARAHPESVLGASAFERAEHWALPQVAQAMRERCPKCSQQLALTLDQKSIMTQKIAIPNKSIRASAWAALAGKSITTTGPFEVSEVMLNTQEWTTVFRHSASGIWFAPGLVWAAHLTPDIRDADVYRIMMALELLLQHAPSIVIAEQGAIGDRQMVASNLRYWKKLQMQTAEAIRMGATDANRQLGEPQQTANTSLQTLNQQRHSLNQQRVWRQLEQDYFDISP